MARYITIGYGDQDGYERTDPVQVRNPDAAGVETENGPFLRSALPVAGFARIEADSLERAVDIASRYPCAVAHGVVEVWPLETTQS